MVRETLDRQPGNLSVEVTSGARSEHQKEAPHKNGGEDFVEKRTTARTILSWK